jgi:hypothetical protein
MVAMAGDKQRKRKDGSRSDKQTKAMRQDITARRAGADEARPKTKGNVPKAAKAGRSRSAGAGR